MELEFHNNYVQGSKHIYMLNVDRNSLFWNYLSSGQKGLIEEGLYLIQDLQDHPDFNITDFSYLVFPFAKAYEGFLKKLFLDCGFITRQQYESDHFRIGRALNPYLEKHLRFESVYDKIISYTNDKNLADKLWDMWKRGRNLVFHYFPHNLKALTFNEAEMIIAEMMDVMQKAVSICDVSKS